MNLTEENLAKRFAAQSAVDQVKHRMVIGLGSRSTAEIAIRILGEKAKDGLQIVGVPTSLAHQWRSAIKARSSFF